MQFERSLSCFPPVNPKSAIENLKCHLDDPVRSHQHVRRNRQADLLGRFQLMMNSNFVGCSTGRLAGLAPFKILSTYVAARRNRSVTLTL